MRNKKLEPIRDLFLGALNKEADKLNRDFSYVSCQAYVHFPPNDEPEFGYFSIFLDCGLANVDLDKADNLSLCISVDDHDGKFKINADIAWGEPCYEVLSPVFEKPVNVSDASLVSIYEKLPDLILELRKQIIDYPNGK